MIDLGNLARQGRAFSGSRAWEPAELEALIVLERERKITRTIAADYIRNGILTLENYDKAVKADFVPLTTEDAVKNAEALLKDNKFASAEVKVKVVKVAKVGKKSGKKK